MTKRKPPETHKRPGRPSTETQEVVDLICTRLTQGESLMAICEDEGMPDRATVVSWSMKNPETSAKLSRARAEQADLMDDLIMQTARASTAATAPADRVKLIAYQWRAARLAPHRYGDKLALTGGQPGDAPIRVDTSDRDRAKAMAALIAKASKG